jgi:hypothetical protein
MAGITVGSRVALAGAPVGSKHGTILAMNVSESKPSVVGIANSATVTILDSTGVTVQWDLEAGPSGIKTYPLADLVAVSN